MLSTRAKLNAAFSKTSSEHIKITIQSLRIEKKALKEKVMEVQQELSKSSLQVTQNLDEDLISIVVGADQRDIPPFLKYFWEEQQNYIKSSSRGI